VKPGLSRRELLIGGTGLVVATACGAKSKGSKTSDGSGAGSLAVVQAGPQLLSGVEQRVTLAMFRDQAKIVDSGPATFRFGRNPTALGPPVPATLRKDGIESRPYYQATTRFNEAGLWVAQARWGSQQGFTRLQVIDPAETQVPVPGKPLISTQTPTTADPMGVNPICTREPACPFHDVSLDVALKESRPLAVLFATPALCESRTCGPVLDVLLGESPAFTDRVRFVHVEIYKDLQGSARLPAVEAYHLDFEPILFLADASGTVKSRLDGPFDKQECRQALQALVG
jgi:hypothetical protein